MTQYIWAQSEGVQAHILLHYLGNNILFHWILAFSTPMASQHTM